MNSVSNFTESNTDKYSAHWHNNSDEAGGSGGIGAVGYKMIMVEPVDQYSDGGNLPPDPYVWETEPKDNAGLDIYYEISENNPINLNPSTIISAIPIGSKIESLSGEGHGDWDSISISDNTSAAGNRITLSNDVWIGPGEFGPLADGNYLQPLIPGSLLKITRPNGYAFTVSLAEAYPDESVLEISNEFRLQLLLYNSN